MGIGANIKRLRLERGMTQEELGNLLGVKKAAVQKYESGLVQNLKQSTIRKLCEIFDTTPATFIYEEPEDLLRDSVNCIEMVQTVFGKESVRLLEVFIELDSENKEKVLSYTNDVALVQYLKSKV